MSHKRIMMLIDNREQENPEVPDHRTGTEFRGSAFNTTEADQNEEQEANSKEFIVSQLRRRVSELEQKVRKLESRAVSGKLKSKKRRRKSSQMLREFPCPHEHCGKFYGSDTSLKNHIKIKHGFQQ